MVLVRRPPIARAASACTLALLILRPGISSAQGTAGGFTPVFGGTATTSTAQQRLDAIVTVVAAADSNVTAAESARVLTADAPPRFQENGFYSQISPQLTAAWAGRRAQLSASGATNLRAYNGLRDVLMTSTAGQVGLNMQFSAATRASFNEGVTYAPSFLYGALPGIASSSAESAASTASNEAVDPQRATTSISTLTLSHSVSPRTSFALNSDWQYSLYTGNQVGYSNEHAGHVGGRLSRGFTRNSQFHVGYKYGGGRYGLTPAATTEHTVEVGGDFTRPHSRTRKTTIGFSVGSTMTDGPLLGIAADANGRQFRVIGNVTLDHQVSRTWNIQGAYQRGLNYVQGLARPAFVNSVTAGTRGFINRSINVSFSGAYSTGDATASATPPFTTYTGDARLQVALSRSFAFYTEYLYYFYNFDRNLTLPASVPSHLNRNGVRIGLTTWIPVRQW